MPAEAGIQVVGENNNFKDLDSYARPGPDPGFAGMTAFPLILTQSLEQGGVGNLTMEESRLWRDLMILIPPEAGPPGWIQSRNYDAVFQGGGRPDRNEARQGWRST